MLNNTFNVDLLKPYQVSDMRFCNRPVSKAAPVFFVEDPGPLFGIEMLVRKRVFSRQPAYLVKWSGLPDHNNPWQIECEIKPVVLWNLLRKQLRDSQRKTNAERMPASDTGSPASRRNHSQVSRSAELLQHRAETILKSPALRSSSKRESSTS